MSILRYARRPVCTADPKETLLDAARRMEKEGVGLLVIAAKGRLDGVLSDRDIALQVGSGGRKAARTRIADVMTRSPVTAETGASFAEALALMHRKRVRRLPVLDDEGRVQGIVSTDDLVRLLSREIAGLGGVLDAQLPEGAAPIPGAGPGPGAPSRPAEHFHRDVVTVDAEAKITDVVREMEARAIGSAVVTGERGEAAGLVTDRDVTLRVVAAGLDPARTPVSAVMSAPVIEAAPSESLDILVDRMRNAGVRRIPIVHEGRPVGIVTFDDLLVTFAGELEEIGAGVAEEIRAARIQSGPARLRLEVEDRIEDAAAQLRRLGDQTLRTLGGELEQLVDRLRDSIRWTGMFPAGEGGPLVRELMRTDVRSCSPEDSLAEPARIMWESDCGCVPVVASDGSDRVVGIITDRDIAMSCYTSGQGPSDLQVKQAMATQVRSCRPDDPLSAAERLMQSAQVRRLPVTDASGRLRGILSLADIAEGARGRGAALGAVSEEEVARTLEAICRPRSAPSPGGTEAGAAVRSRR